MRTVVVALTKGAIALVDAADIPIVRPYLWYLTSRGYAARTARDGGGVILMHREILCAPSGAEVDHANLDTLDNRRSNLRLCTHAQNMANRGPIGGRRFKGVYMQRDTRGFRAEFAGEYLGVFDSEVEAALAYDRRALERYGAFARLNFPGVGQSGQSSDSLTLV